MSAVTTLGIMVNKVWTALVTSIFLALHLVEVCEIRVQMRAIFNLKLSAGVEKMQ